MLTPQDIRAAKEFEQDLQHFFPDLNIRFHRGMERWIVAEPKNPTIITMQNVNEYGIVYVIQTEDGDYCRPETVHLQEVLAKLDSAFTTRTGIDAEIDRLDLATIQRETAKNPEVQDMLEQAENELIAFDLRGRRTTRMGR